MIKYPIAVVLVAGGMLAMTACGSSPGTVAGGSTTSASPSPTGASASPSASPSAPPVADCGTATPRTGDLVELTRADNGEKLCVNLGATVEVLLQGTTADKWKPITSSSQLILAPKLDPGLTIPAGWTGAAFEAIRSGTAYAGSIRYPCGTGTKGRNDAQCGVIEAYRVNITVASLRSCTTARTSTSPSMPHYWAYSPLNVTSTGL
jgi:hypothetical protein